MRCPFCNAVETKVIDSRLVSNGGQVRRRRECIDCQERFSTYESAELVMPRLIKRDGSHVPFDEEKLRSGLNRALEKRPVNTESVEASINRIMQAMRANGEREISSAHVGELVMTELSLLDQVAYVRFASVYRSFQDMNAFREEINKLENQETESNKA